MRLQPTENYELLLPDDSKHKVELDIASIWRLGSSLALQLSSHLRFAGEQVHADERLAARIRTDSSRWHRIELSAMLPEARVAAAIREEEELEWLHVYITWPDLMIYATVSGQ